VIEDRGDRAGAAGPTVRQREVLRGVVNGLTAKEVARRLGISARTVEGHLHAVRRLTGARSMGELCALSVARGWVAPQQPAAGPGRPCPETVGSCSETPGRQPRGGRPTVMTPQRIVAARELLRTHTVKETARNLRVSRSTLYAHMDVITAGSA
jgi:DNA-binding CsgD family transcriptional regulator